MANYTNKRIYGRGSYKARGAYKKRGGYIADGLSGLGKQGGQFLGKALGKVIEKYTGLGAYKKYGGSGAYKAKRIDGRGAYNGRGSYHEIERGMIAPLPPQFTTSRGGNWVEIAHREYIGDVFSSSVANTLNISSFYINPSDTVTFPWLSQIAALAFQQYELMGCIFEFESFSSDALNSTNTALGTVVTAINYDSTDAIPTTRGDMENTDWSQAKKPSQSFIIPVECARRETFGGGLLYTRQSQTIPTGEDRRLYDLGRLDIATLGVQGTSVNLGSLYVTYKVRLYKKISFAPAILNGLYHHWNNTSISAVGAPIGVVANDTVVHNNMGVVHTSGTVLTIPLRYLHPTAVYRLDVLWFGTSAACTAPVVTFSGALSAVNGVGTTSSMNSSSYGTPNGTTTVTLTVAYFFQVGATPTANGSIIFGTAGTIPTSGSVDVQISQISGNWNQNV